MVDLTIYRFSGIALPSFMNVLWYCQDRTGMIEHNHWYQRVLSIRFVLLLPLVLLGAIFGHVERPVRPWLLQNTPNERTSRRTSEFLPIAGPFQPDGPQPVQLGDAAKADVPDDWYNTIMANIAASEYHINWQEGVGAFQSPNRQQDLRITYHAAGFDLWPRTDSAAWQVHLALDRIGRPGAWLLPSDSATLSTNGPDLVADHGAFTMDYHNAEEGMRQNFTVRERPIGDGPLQVRLNYSGDLHAADKGGNAIAFCIPVEGTSSYVPTLWYKDLHVWDANGDTLQATAMLEGDDVVISVHDAFAEYPVTVDPLSTTADWTAESDQINAHFGGCVSSAGDVNGDGYSDVIIGAPDYDNGQTDEGRAYVYAGSATGTGAAALWVAESNSTGALFGTAVSSAGDVNNDGYSDIVVGSPGFSNGQTNEGRIQVYHGSAAGPAATANRTIESNSALSRMGASVALAGDVNNDGYSDVIVGSPDYTNGQTNEGRAQVFHGSAGGLTAAAGWWHESDQINAHEGWSVGGAGNVNGDTYSDIIVGAYLFDNGQTDEGRVFVFHGSFGGLVATPTWTAESNQAGAQFGYSVACAGDVNGDGYSDVIIGSPDFDNGQANEGRALVYYGSAAGLAATAAWTTESNQVSASLGAVVACAGDVNGDGYSDVIIGAASYEIGQTDEGWAFLYYGSATGLSFIADWTAESNQAGAAYGWWVASAGDVNGDGYSDVIVGASDFDNGQTDEGRAFVYHGSALGLSAIANWTAESDQAGAFFGASVSSAGDVNGDGYSDVIVGAYFFDNGQTDEGRAFVYHGSALGLSAIANWTAESDQAGAIFGFSVSSAGDVNGDGYSDVIVGAFYFDNGQSDSDEGRAYVYHGSALGLSAIANWTAESDQVGAIFGFSVSSAGDVNGDGYSDVIVGAYLFDNGQSNEGRAFVYHGNNGTGRRHNLRLYNTNLTSPISASNISATQFGAGLYAKPFLGRQHTRMVWETRSQGQAFSSAGGRITNSVQSTAQQAVTTQTAVAGTELKAIQDKVLGANQPRVTNERARLRYEKATAITGQVYGPWRYMPSHLEGRAPMVRQLSPCESSPPIRLDVKVFLEGPFLSDQGLMSDQLRILGLLPLTEPYTALGLVITGPNTTNPGVLAVAGNNAIVDWVLVELRDAPTGATVVERRVALVQRDGDVVGVDGVSQLAFCSVAGSYRVAVRHRNHLGVMTSAAVGLGTIPLLVDLRLASTPTWGTNARKSISGAYPAQVLWAGDVTFNGQLKYTGTGNDRDVILQAIGGTVATNTAAGYLPSDVNMDGQAKYTGIGNDRDIILQNIGGTVATAIRDAQIP